jgi:hypothetical protein
LLPIHSSIKKEKEKRRIVLHKIKSMGIPTDDVVLIQEPDSAGDPTVITVSCPDKTGLGCDLCRVILLFGLNIVKGGDSKA